MHINWINQPYTWVTPPAENIGGKLVSISDDDLCADCVHCGYAPGDMSSCAQDWPGTQDEDGYYVTCPQFDKCHPGVHR